MGSAHNDPAPGQTNRGQHPTFSPGPHGPTILSGVWIRQVLCSHTLTAIAGREMTAWHSLRCPAAMLTGRDVTAEGESPDTLRPGNRKIAVGELGIKVDWPDAGGAGRGLKKWKLEE